MKGDCHSLCDFLVNESVDKLSGVHLGGSLMLCLDCVYEVWES